MQKIHLQRNWRTHTRVYVMCLYHACMRTYAFDLALENVIHKLYPTVRMRTFSISTFGACAIHTYIRIYIHTYIHTYIYIYIYCTRAQSFDMHTGRYTCLHKPYCEWKAEPVRIYYIHVQVHESTQISVVKYKAPQTYMHIHAHRCHRSIINEFLHTHASTCMHTKSARRPRLCLNRPGNACFCAY